MCAADYAWTRHWSGSALYCKQHVHVWHRAKPFEQRGAGKRICTNLKCDACLRGPDVDGRRRFEVNVTEMSHCEILPKYVTGGIHSIFFITSRRLLGLIFRDELVQMSLWLRRDVMRQIFVSVILDVFPCLHLNCWINASHISGSQSSSEFSLSLPLMYRGNLLSLEDEC